MLCLCVNVVKDSIVEIFIYKGLFIIIVKLNILELWSGQNWNDEDIKYMLYLSLNLVGTMRKIKDTPTR